MRTNLQISLSILLLLTVLSACQPTRFVPKEKYLLRSNPSLQVDKRLSSRQLEDAISLEANRKIGFSRVYLWLYNLGASMEKDTGWARKQILRIDKVATTHEKVVKALKEGIGEGPALVNLNQIRKDSAAIGNVCFSKGFFHPDIRYEIDTLRTWLRKRETGMATVTYLVEGGNRYLIRNATAVLGDSLAPDSVLDIIGWKESVLAPMNPYDQSVLIRERGRITDYLRNNGFFTVSPALISFFVDTLTSDTGTAAFTPEGYKLIDVKVILSELPLRFTISEVVLTIKQDDAQYSPLYKPSVNLRPGRITREEYERLELSSRVLSDSLDMTFVVDEELVTDMDFNFLASRIHLREGDPFSQYNARLTLQRLQDLGMLRFATIKYELNENKQELRVLLEAQMAPHFQIKAGFESFYNGISSIGNNLPSIGGNVSLRNRNAFHQSELLEFGISGAVGFYSPNIEASSVRQLYYGLGSQLNMNIPGLLAPVFRKRDLSNLSPATLASLEIIADQRREFDRFKAGGRLSYRWNHEPFSSQAVSELTPLFFEFIDTRTDSTFQADIVDKLPPAIRRDFEQRISTRVQYAFTYQDYRSTRARPTSWSRFAVEVGGNLPYLLDNLSFLRTGTNDTSTSDQLVAGRLFYGQYIKASAEIKYQIPFRDQSDLVFRMFIGGAVPYNGSPAVPRESRFFSGGPGSMRGWRSNTLGPGTLSLDELTAENNTFQDNTGLSLIAPGGEWIFEANAEYRFKILPPYFELGLFTDVGNVWFHNSSQIIEQVGEKAVISPENFRVGWDAGIGLRFDFDLVIFRIDIGQQIYAPDIGWVISADGLRRFPEPNIGVDYPF